jgi:hypothetical protein
MIRLLGRRNKLGEDVLYTGSSSSKMSTEISRGRGALVNNRGCGNQNQSSYRGHGHGCIVKEEEAIIFNKDQTILEEVNQKDLQITIINLEEAET